MKLSMMIRAADPIEQDLCAQLGVKYAITKAAPELTGMNAPWDLEALRTVQERFTSRGITLYGLEGDEFDMTRIKLGLPGRDEDLQKYCRIGICRATVSLQLATHQIPARYPNCPDCGVSAFVWHSRSAATVF